LGFRLPKGPLFIDLPPLLKTLQFSDIDMMMAQKLSSNINENEASTGHGEVVKPDT
jgi:hypothetical protein